MNLKITKIIKKPFFLVCILLTHAVSSLWGDNSFEVQNNLTRISNNDRFLLEKFFKEMLWGSECGYVLYGNKPMCFIGLSSTVGYPPGMMGHRQFVTFNNGIRIWEKLGLRKESNNYLLHICEEKKSGTRFFLLINRQSFLKIVNDNLALFQYILGTQVSAQALLKKLIDPSEDFGEVLKNNKVLIGIILGYGVNNALHVNREELISESQQNLTNDPDDYQEAGGESINSSLKPGFGYISLQQELEDLNSRTNTCSRNLEKEFPGLLFGCIAGTEESLNLIKHYEEVQLKLIKLLESNHFLDEVLSHFYGEDAPTDFETKVPHTFAFLDTFKKDRPLHALNPYLPRMPPIDWSAIVAFSIWNIFTSLDETANEDPTMMTSFIEGMRAANLRENAPFYATHGELYYVLPNESEAQDHAFFTGFKTWAHYKAGNKLYSFDEVLRKLPCACKDDDLSISAQHTIHEIIDRLHQYLYQEQENLETMKAEHFFSKFRVQIPSVLLNAKQEQCLHYQPIVKGSGDCIRENDILKIRYRIKTLSGYELDSSKNNFEVVDLQRTMPGLRKGLEGLRVGSKGVLYIHPNAGFRDSFDLPSIKPFLIVELEIHSKL